MSDRVVAPGQAVPEYDQAVEIIFTSAEFSGSVIPAALHAFDSAARGGNAGIQDFDLSGDFRTSLI